jgi:hypothetical protein
VCEIKLESACRKVNSCSQIDIVCVVRLLSCRDLLSIQILLEPCEDPADLLWLPEIRHGVGDLNARRKRTVPLAEPCGRRGD